MQTIANKNHKKRHILCLDGTWQTIQDKHPTNVRLIYNAIAPTDGKGTLQIKKYFNGAATNGSYLSKLFNAITGADVKHRIKEAYKYLVEHYRPGDDIILIGYSRGAFIARALNGLIYKSGIITHTKHNISAKVEKAYDFYKTADGPNAKAAQEFRIQNSYSKRPQTSIACFDTVGRIAVPDKLSVFDMLSLPFIFNWNYRLHHNTKTNCNTLAAIHALAFHEQRKLYSVIPFMQDVRKKTIIKQKYFVGNHGVIGGGLENKALKPLSDISGLWVAKQLQKHANLAFNPTILKQSFQPDPLADVNNEFKPNSFWRLTGWGRRVIDFSNHSLLHKSLIDRSHYRAMKRLPI